MEKYKEELVSEIKIRSLTERITERESFFDIYCEKLIESEIIEDYHYLFFKGKGKNGLNIQIDGYIYNEIDEKLILFFMPELVYYESETLTQTSANNFFKKAKGFYFDADKIIKESEESSEGYGLAWDISNKKMKIEKLEIIILTDQEKSNTINTIERTIEKDIRIEYSIFDINRMKLMDESKNGREVLEINIFEEFGLEGIPVLPASQTSEYSAFLCNISGELLAKMYDKYQSRLLEGNVRSFLQTRGKVNRGIRNTILKEPEMFFAFNNGIAATAEEIMFNENKTSIIGFKELQIVNGGQTTASLASAWVNDTRHNSRELIKKIYVPMKISVVTSEIAQDLVPKISKYANSQNKVSDADLESNHEFHRIIEEKSRRILAPAIGGAQFGTYWYYERANGQYRQETYKATESNKKKFLSLNPKDQMFKKVDLAKYYNIFLQKPYIASAGAQKSFMTFTTWMIPKWEKNKNFITDEFYREIISLAILFKKSDFIVRTQTWYDSYKANIVAYTLSAIFHRVEIDYPEYGIDILQIWKKQDISVGWYKQIQLVSRIMYEHLVSSERSVENVTEWAKKETSWLIAKDIRFEILPEFKNELLLKTYIVGRNNSAIKEQKEINEMTALLEVYEYGELFWKDVESWGNRESIWNVQDKSFLKLATNIESSMRQPTDKQSVKILQLLEKARFEGFIK